MLRIGPGCPSSLVPSASPRYGHDVMCRKLKKEADVCRAVDAGPLGEEAADALAALGPQLTRLSLQGAEASGATVGAAKVDCSCGVRSDVHWPPDARPAINRLHGVKQRHPLQIVMPQGSEGVGSLV